MPPSIDLEHLDHISDSAYWAAWDRYAEVALQSLLSFHGASDSTAPSAAADHAAQCATEMMACRLELVVELEEVRQQRAEERKAEKAKPAAKR